LSDGHPGARLAGDNSMDGNPYDDRYCGERYEP
jgi:hypothetical protein